jgi:hypothetical protein
MDGQDVGQRLGGEETLRGPALDSLPFSDRGKVVALLDGLPALDAARTALHPVLMILLSACCLHQRYFH